MGFVKGKQFGFRLDFPLVLSMSATNLTVFWFWKILISIFISVKC